MKGSDHAAVTPWMRGAGTSSRTRWAFILLATLVTYTVLGIIGIAGFCSTAIDTMPLSACVAEFHAHGAVWIGGPLWFLGFFFSFIPDPATLIVFVAILVLAGWWSTRTLVRIRKSARRAAAR